MKSKYYQQENQKNDDQSQNRDESIYSDIKINQKLKPFEDIDILENTKNIQSARKSNSPFKGEIRKLHSDKKVEKFQKKIDISNFSIKSPQIPLYPKNSIPNNNLMNFNKLQKSNSQHNFMHDSLTFNNKSIDLNSSHQFVLKKKSNFQQTNQSYLNAMKALQDKIKILEQQVVDIQQQSESQLVQINYQKNLELDEQKEIFDKLEQSLLRKIKILEKKCNESHQIQLEKDQNEKELQEKFFQLQTSTNQRISTMDQNLNILEQKLESQLKINQQLKNQNMHNHELNDKKEDQLQLKNKQLEIQIKQCKQNNSELAEQNNTLKQQIQGEQSLKKQEIEMIHKKYSNEITSLRNDLENIEQNLKQQVELNQHNLVVKENQTHDLIEKIDKLCYDNEQLAETLLTHESQLKDLQQENIQQRTKFTNLLEKFIKIIDNLDNQELLLENLLSIKKDDSLITFQQIFDVQINRIQDQISQHQKNDIYLQNIIELEQQIVELNQQLQTSQLNKNQQQLIQNEILQKSHKLFQLKQDQEQ